MTPAVDRSVAEHRAIILEAVRPLAVETVGFADMLARTLAEDVRASLRIPAFDNSAMDGYAVRAVDGASARRVVIDLPAGTAPGAQIGGGEAARIMTGAPLPLGADAIVPHEDTAEAFRAVGAGDTITVLVAPSVGAHVRRSGEDAEIGDVVVAAGERVGTLQRAAAVAAGATSARVHRTPRVVVIASGDELVAPGEPVPPGAIPESNGLLLAGAIAEADAEVADLVRVGDDPRVLRGILNRWEAEAPDAIVLTGGASVGAFEVVREVLEPAGVPFVRVAMQPGKPQGFGVIGAGIPVFCLPGNPVSVAVSFETFVRPALLRMQGRAVLDRPLVRLPVSAGWRTPPGREQYMPVRFDRSDPGAWTVAPATAGGSGSHRAGSLALVEGWARVAADVTEVCPGDRVDVMLVR